MALMMFQKIVINRQVWLVAINKSWTNEWSWLLLNGTLERKRQIKSVEYYD